MLFTPAQFSARAAALDWLDAQFGVPPGPAATAEQVALHARANALQQQLEAVNEQLFQHLRRQIATGTHTPQQLERLFAAYVDLDWRRHDADDMGYDELDLFFSGLLAGEPAPAVIAPDEPGMVGYQPTPKRLILELIARAELRPDDVFVDIGAGLGHVALLVAMLGGVSAIGIEVQPTYCAYARSCTAQLQLAGVTFVQRDARSADFSRGTVFYLYTPCRGAMFDALLERLYAESRRRALRIISYGPCSQDIARQTWVEEVSVERPNAALRFFRALTQTSAPV